MVIALNETVDNVLALKKVLNSSSPLELGEKDLANLVEILNPDDMLKNFSEKGLRSYRDPYSGQPLTGVSEVLDKNGDLFAYRFCPDLEHTTKAQLYDGLVFFLINPAVKKLTKYLFRLRPSDFALMTISEASLWGKLADTLTHVKSWSKHWPILRDPGEIMAPFNCSGDANLDLLIFAKMKMPEYEFLSFADEVLFCT